MTMTEIESKKMLEQPNGLEANGQAGLSDISDKELDSLFNELRAGKPPTSNLAPSSAFVDGVLAGISAKAAVSAAAASAALTASSATAASGSAMASSAAASSLSAAAKAVIGTAIALAAAGAVAYSSAGENIVSSLKGHKPEEAKKSVIETEVKQLKESGSANKAPILRFSSPSEDVD